MQIPLEIRYHHLDPSPALDAEIRAHVDKLERLYPRLTGCRVAVECQHHQHQTGNLREVHIELSVPGSKLVVSREPHKPLQAFAHPDVRTALKEAFRAAERQLKDYKDQQHGEVKTHPIMLHATVSQLVAEQDHGFLMTATGALLYFNRTSFLNEPLEGLRVGDSVHYTEVDGDNGQVASKVWRAKAEAAE
jgi:ribosome-associated translation inhibitor RaiA